MLKSISFIYIFAVLSSQLNWFIKRIFYSTLPKNNIPLMPLIEAHLRGLFIYSPYVYEFKKV